jgi:hypothetical protein
MPNPTPLRVGEKSIDERKEQNARISTRHNYYGPAGGHGRRPLANDPGFS